LSLLANSNAIETGGYQISRSVRLRSSASAYFNRTPASASNRKTYSFSGWVKKCGQAANQNIIAQGNNEVLFRFNTSDYINFADYTGGSAVWELTSASVYRDPSAWYHIVFAVDTTQATSSNRIKVWVNNLQVTFTGTYPSLNADTPFNTTNAMLIGNRTGATQYFDGYLTEINFIDGQALTPSSFGQTDTITGSWVAKKYTGTYGTNGFYLNFSDNSAATAAAIGKDSSGNGNNWTPNNISVTAGSTYDSMLDVPSGNGYADGGNGRGNYCVMNPLANSGIGTLSNGNLTLVTSTNSKTISGTMALPSTGQYYFEVTATDYVTDGGTFFGLVNSSFLTGAPSNGTWLGFNTYSGTYNNGTSTDTNNLTGTNVTQDGDIWCIAVDVTNGKFWIGRSRSGSLTWADGVTPAVNGSGATTLSLPSGTLYPMAYRGGSLNETYDFNFGQRSTGFAHTPPTGFNALNTTNLTTPTIGATSTTQAGKYMNAVLYTGTGSSNAQTGVGFQPDLVWIKSRSGATDHGWYDAVRGVQKQLESNTTTAETTETTGLTAFGSDGFTVGALAQLNTSSATYVAWNWKANGTGSTNTAGTITSTVSANTTSGFSIVTYTGTGANATVGHGLGVAPQMIIVKCRSNSATSWRVAHSGMGTMGSYMAYLELTNAASSTAIWNSTQPTSSVFSVGTDPDVNGSTRTYVAYVFAPISGYSAFGSYTGNGSTDGPFVYCGFRPAYILIKSSTDGTTNWLISDNKRLGYNITSNQLKANTSAAEESFASGWHIDFVSNGFKVRNNFANMNGSGTYIYAAFAENPFKFSNAR
jgi:hypothetical protein